MAVKDWSTTAASNTGIISGMSLDGSVMTVNQTDNAFRDMAAQIAAQLGKLGFKGADIASATTTNLANATGWYVDITGTTTITGLGTVDAGQMFMLRFAGALTFTHNATSLILPGAANITTAAGDVAIVVSLGSGNWKCVVFQRANGQAVVSASAASETVAGLVELATDAEAQTGTDTARAITPANLQAVTATQTRKGVIEIATAAEYQVGTDDDRALTPGQVYDAAAMVTLTDAATIAVDMSTFINATVTIAGNRTLGNPTNAKIGQSGCIRVTASGGDRTINKGANWSSATSFPVTVSSGTSAFLFYFIFASNSALVTVVNGVS